MIPKPHKSYEEQLELLEGRGMLVDNTSAALNLLKHASYYTLSGYWYPFRERLPDGSRGDNFRSGTKLTDFQVACAKSFCFETIHVAPRFVRPPSWRLIISFHIETLVLQTGRMLPGCVQRATRRKRIGAGGMRVMRQHWKSSPQPVTGTPSIQGR